jgi:uncharacterized membrane protein YkvA (DUF1232 family)
MDIRVSRLLAWSIEMCPEGVHRAINKCSAAGRRWSCGERNVTAAGNQGGKAPESAHLRGAPAIPMFQPMSEFYPEADEAALIALPPRERGRFRRVRDRFWPKLRRAIGHIPFAEDVVAAYFCAFDRDTPTKVRLTLLAALAYFILPTDAIPDVLPVIGYTDDASVIAAAIAMVAGNITERHRAAARSALERLRAAD